MPQPTQKSAHLSTDASSPTATAIATISNGEVTGLTLTNGGSGYTSVPNVVISGGGGFGASASANILDGSVSSFKVLSGGRGYTSTPTVDISLDGGTALLTYGILPTPNPLQVSQTSTLALVVSNSGSTIVDCASIAVSFPGPSENAQDLTDSFSGIAVQVPSDGDNPLWLSSQNGGTFTLTPITAAAGQIGATGLYFIFANILVNQSVGACMATIVETSSASSQPNGTRNAPSIEIQKWPTQFSMSPPTATPTQVLYKTGSTLVSWSVIGTGVTTSLLYDPDGNGIQTFPVSNVGSKPVDNLTNPSDVVIFTVQASVAVPGQSQPMTVQKQITVTILPTPTIEFTIQPNNITLGKPLTFTLAWTLADITNFQITANDGPNGNTVVLPVPFSTSGSYIVTPHLLNVTYTLQVISTTTTPRVTKEKK